MAFVQMMSSNASEWVFRKEFIEQTDGARGKLYRCKSIWFMEDLGHAAKLDRRVTSTASVYFHRFFLFHSFTQHDRFQVAAACLFLAAKVEESAIRLKEIVHKFYQVRHSGIFPDEKTVADLQKTLVLIERLVLNTLNFDLYVVHPNIGGKYKEIKNYIPEEHRQTTLQTAINFVNDSYRSTLCLQYAPGLIATAMIYLSLIVLSVKPVSSSGGGSGSSYRSAAYTSTETTWISLLEKEIDHLTLRNICFEVLDLYELTSDKALKIKDKNFVKDQICNDLTMQPNSTADHHRQISEGGSALSPSQEEEIYDDQKYEEEHDVFHIRKITVTHHLQQQQQTVITTAAAVSASSSSSFVLPPSDSPANGSESVYSTMSSSHQSLYQTNEYAYLPDETPIPEPPETPVEGGNSIYHSFLQQEEEDPSGDTPSFQDLPRLPARERSLSLSESSYQHESNKRPRLE